jgi:hypothetical protein
MSGRQRFGRSLGRWERYVSLGVACPGCEYVSRESHDACRRKLHEHGVFVDCWRLANGSLPPGFIDPGFAGALGCRRFFIPDELLRGVVPSRPPAPRCHKRPDQGPELSGDTISRWCEFLHVTMSSHRARERVVSEFYASRDVPFDLRLYGVGPSRIEASALATSRLPHFILQEGLEGFVGLPGVVPSSRGDGAFFPAAKHGEAWEWVRDSGGNRVSWSRRFLCPDKEGANAPKAKLPSGSTHHLHHVPGWRECAQRSGALLLTEGVRKANEVQRRTGVAALGLPSVTISRGPRAELESAIRDARPPLLLLAPDFADLCDGECRHDPTRIQVRGWEWLVSFSGQLGIDVRALAWDPTLGKGIDDVLATLRTASSEGSTP